MGYMHIDNLYKDLRILKNVMQWRKYIEQVLDLLGKTINFLILVEV